uniref:Autophagy-related protein 101 n=1 Tax=Neovison vison TaxID=452646 RepID=A0A8C7AGY3_NEOVI
MDSSKRGRYFLLSIKKIREVIKTKRSTFSRSSLWPSVSAGVAVRWGGGCADVGPGRECSHPRQRPMEPVDLPGWRGAEARTSAAGTASCRGGRAAPVRGFAVRSGTQAWVGGGPFRLTVCPLPLFSLGLSRRRGRRGAFAREEEQGHGPNLKDLRSNLYAVAPGWGEAPRRLLFSFLSCPRVRAPGCRMNCRSEVLEVSVEGRQVEEAMLAVLHTVLLHRSTGKFHYKKEGTYSIGTVGTQDVDCDFIDFTYVRVSSEELDRALRKVVGEFKDALRNSGGDGLGQMSLEFYQKKKSRWPFSDECIPWEVWTVKVHVVALATEQERQICREKVGEKLCEKVINIVEVMNRHEYLPKMPTQSEVDNVFDTGLRDVQPYLYKISFQITDALGTSVTTTMRRLIKDTLAL